MSLKKQKYDLTQGSILGKLLLISLPIMGTQLLQMAYNLTDMFWLGRLSSQAVAASGTAGMYLWLSNGFMFIGRTGAEIGVSQHLGSKDEDGARRFAQVSMFLSVLLSVGFSLIAFFFAHPLIGFFGMNDVSVARDAAEYLMITAIGIPAAFISATAAGTFNASGNSSTPFFINAVGLVLNIILDPICIFTLNLGIHGAAYATVFAQIVVALLSVIALKAKRFQPLRKFRFFAKPDWTSIKKIFYWSTPVAMESMFFTFLSMIITRLITGFGTDAIAVQRVGSQVESLSWLISGGFATAVTAFIGQNFGAGKWSRIRKGYKISLVSIVCWGIFVSALLFFAGGFLFGVFMPDPTLVEMGAYYLKVLALCQVFGSLEAACAGAFRGMGKTLPPSIASIGCNVFRVVLTYFLAEKFGLNGIWWGISLGACSRGIIIFVWFQFTLHKQPKKDLYAV